jgi:hypothetical protein
MLVLVISLVGGGVVRILLAVTTMGACKQQMVECEFRLHLF